MKKKHSSIINEINKLLKDKLWFDFQVLNYDKHKLIIAGSEDLSYYHQLEIIFENVFFVQAFFQEWRTNPSNGIIQLADPYNTKFEIEKGYQLFELPTDDYENNVYIAAESISYNTDTVYYYFRENLAKHERLADWVEPK